MKERHFKQTLQEVAEEKVPAVDLWPEIERQIAPRKRWRQGLQLAGGLAGAALVLVAVLLFASWMASFSQESEQAAAQSEGTVTSAAAATVDAWPGLHLTDSTILRDDVAPGDTLFVDLEWQAPTSPLENVSLFLHLVDGDGHLVGQSDVRMETADWPLDRPVRSGHQLLVPSELALGSYSLQLSLYNRDSERLTPFVAYRNLIEGGIVEIAEIDVTATGDYWDGGRWSGEPVYGETNGISRAAHDLFTSCGLVDHEIEQAVRRFQSSGSAREIIEPGQSESFSLRKIIDVVPLTEDVYRVSCLRLREDEPVPPAPQELLANLRLLAHSLSQTALGPREPLELGVTWYNSVATGLDVSQFVHLLDEDGNIVVQKDTAISFDVGTVSQVRFTDTLNLPSTVSPGQYQLVIGLYDRISGERLPFSTGEGRAVPTGKLRLSTIWIEEDSNALTPGAACPVSEPIYDQPPDDPNADPFALAEWYVNEERTMWAGPLPEDGMWQNGSERVFWIRPTGSDLQISGRRLDGDAPPLDATIPCCYPTGFQVTALNFPTSGCWEVIGRSGDDVLRFVTEVEPGEDVDTGGVAPILEAVAERSSNAWFRAPTP